jgi:tetratricopeptide (TPR) repeat protein
VPARPARILLARRPKRRPRSTSDYLLQGDEQKAAAAYTKAIQADPKCQTAYVRRGMVYAEVGEHKKALADYTKAIELDPRDSYPYELRRDLYRNVYHDEAKAKADDEAAFLARQKRWDQLQELRKKR